MSSEPAVKILDGSFSLSESRRATLFSSLLLSGLVVILYAPILRSMARQWWDDPNYGHGMLVPLFVAYVLWRERSRWLTVSVRPSDYGLPLMLSAMGLLILGMLSAELFTARFSLILLICGIIVFLAGWPVPPRQKQSSYIKIGNLEVIR